MKKVEEWVKRLTSVTKSLAETEDLELAAMCVHSFIHPFWSTSMTVGSHYSQYSMT